MIVVTVVESAILVVLCILVAGLLRSYATVLQRLHQLDGGAAESAPPFRTAAGVTPPRVATAARTANRPAGADQPEWGPGHDLMGVGLTGEIISIRTVGTGVDTVLVFLSSGCSGCTGFWEDFAQRRELSVAPDGRVIVVTKDPEVESTSLLAEMCPPGVDLVMSSRAWEDYGVPGSPYVVVVSGTSGMVSGEGSGTSLTQLSGLVHQALGDSLLAGTGQRLRKPRADTEREVDVDRALLAAGIGPGDPSLYPSAGEPTRQAELIGFPGYGPEITQ